MTATLVFNSLLISMALAAPSNRIESESPMGGCDYVVRNVVQSAEVRIKAAIVDVQCGATTRNASWIVLAGKDSDFSYEKDRAASFNGAISEIEWSGSDIVVSLGLATPVKIEKLPRGGSIFFLPRAGSEEAGL